MLFEKDPIDVAIEKAMKEAESFPANSSEYTTIARNVNTLADAKEKQHADQVKLNPNDILKIVATAALVYVTMNFEQTQCYTTKATMWLRKLW